MIFDKFYGAIDIMRKSTYDTDDNAIVDQAEKINFESTAGEALVSGEGVAFNAITGKVVKADASDADKMPCIGFIDVGGALDATVTVQDAGLITPAQTENFDPSETVFISPTTPGATTKNSPAVAGQISQPVGIARTVTEMFIQIEQETIIGP